MGTTTKPDAPTTTLITLPLEIRTKIYRTLWHNNVEVSLHPSSRPNGHIPPRLPTEYPIPIHWPAFPALALVNKQLSSEAIPEYYRTVRICSSPASDAALARLFEKLQKKRSFLKHVRILSLSYRDFIFKLEALELLKAIEGLKLLRVVCHAAYEPVGTALGRTFEKEVVVKALKKAVRCQTILMGGGKDYWYLPFRHLYGLVPLVLEFEYQYVDKGNVQAHRGAPEDEGTTAKKKVLCTFSLPGGRLVIDGEEIP